MPLEADALAAVTSGDNSNILTARIARETYEIPNVVARIYDPRRAEIYQRLGIPTVATVTWTIDQVRRRLLPDEDVGRLVRPDRAPRPRRALAPRGLGRAGRCATSSMPGQAQPGGGHPRRRAAARRRATSSARRATSCTSPCSTTRWRELDETLAAGTDAAARDGRVVKVAIAGAGSVGTAIASDLHANGHEVLVIEQDPDLVERLRPTLDVTWVAADACEVVSLDAAGLATVDVVVAATGDDEDNLVISLLAKQEFAVPRVVARVNHPKNQWLFNESWGVDVSVSTPQLLTALVEEAVSVGLARPAAAVRGRHRPPGRGHPGRGLAGRRTPPSPTSHFPRDAAVVAVVRGDRLIVPRGDTALQSGDEVLVLVDRPTPRTPCTRCSSRSTA